MALCIFKWWMVFSAFFIDTEPRVHPYYVSVTEIAHNSSGQTLEVSCKIFTDDFEQTLKLATGKKIDLLNPLVKEAMKPFVGNYILEHLRLAADGKMVKLAFLGYERDEEGVIAFFEAGGIRDVKKLEVYNDLLYEFHPSQIGLMHVTVNGKRKSRKLDNPEKNALFVF